MSGLFLGLQKALPQHGLSRLVGWLAQSQIPVIRCSFIHLFAKAYDISLADAERKGLDDYKSFNDFFTRALADGARPLPEQPNALACPVDGTVSQIGRIQSDLLMQAKGHSNAAPLANSCDFDDLTIIATKYWGLTLEDAG